MVVLKVLLSCLLCPAVIFAAQLPVAEVHSVSPHGIEFRLKDVPGMSRAGFHYSINTPISGNSAGQWNYDEDHKTDGYWVHTNVHVDLHPGDKVYFWEFAIINGIGTSHMGLSATIGLSSQGETHTQPPNTGHVTPQPHPSNLRLIFSDEFDNIDTSKWDYEISAFGGGNWEFQVYTPEKANTYIKDGTLFIKPGPTADKFGEAFLTTGIMDVAKIWGKCTDSRWYGCVRNSKDAFLPPIMSGKLMSKQTFKYGRFELMAKMPRGDWLWPTLWLMPKNEAYGGWPRSGEIDIVETRGNRDLGNIGINHMMSTLHWGVDEYNDRWPMTTAGRDGSWADGFHKYVLDWDSTHIIISVDDHVVLSAPTPPASYYQKGNFNGNNVWSAAGKDAPFDQEFFLIISVAVGGTTGFFPDHLGGLPYPKPWTNTDTLAPRHFWDAKSKWHPSWQGEDAALQVKYVKVWAK